MCIYTLKGLYKLLTSSSHTRCMFTGDLGMFTNGHEDQMEHRLSEGVQPVLVNSLTRSNTYTQTQTHAEENPDSTLPDLDMRIY